MQPEQHELKRAGHLTVGYELSELSGLERATDEAAAVKLILGHPLDPSTVRRRGPARTPLVIVGYDQRQILKLLREQRCTAATALRPIAVVGIAEGEALPVVEALADATAPPRAAPEALERLRDRLLALMGAVDNLAAAEDDPTMRLLQFLLTREAEVRPQLDPSAPSAYRFPVAEHMLRTSNTEALDVLQDLAEHQLLHARAVDRVFLCPQCNGYRVPVKELCPECQSPNVAMQDSLHHFRCGYVGPESEFMGSGRPTCPKCHDALRHIGVEYNRPGRIVICAACGHWASEPHLRAWCVDCNVYHAPEDLRTARISRFALTQDGSRVARLGRWNPAQTQVLPGAGTADPGNADAPSRAIPAQDMLHALIEIASENHWPMAVYRADVMMPLARAPSENERSELIASAEHQIRQCLGPKDVIAQVHPGTFLILATRERRKGSAAQELQHRVERIAHTHVQVSALSAGEAAQLFAPPEQHNHA